MLCGFKCHMLIAVTGLDLHFALWAKIIVATSVCTGVSKCPPDTCIEMGSSRPRHKKYRRGKRLSCIFGAGDRTRTGTLSPAVDFESVGLFGIQWNVVEPSGIFHLTKHTQPVVFAPKKLQFSAKQPQSKRF